MERNASQDWLELFDPDRPDPDVGDVDGLRRQLADSPELARQLQLRLRADERIGAAVRDIPIPVELKAAVLSRLSQRQAAPSPGKGRRHAVLGLAAIAACLTIACLFTLFTKKPSWSHDLVADEALRLFDQQAILGKGNRILPGIKPQFVRTSQSTIFQGIESSVFWLYEPKSKVSAVVVIVPISNPREVDAILDRFGPKYHDSSRGITLLFSSTDEGLRIVVVKDASDFDLFIDRPEVT